MMCESFFKSFLARRTSQNVITLRNKYTFRFIIALVAINTLISVIILREQTSYNVFFNVIYENSNLTYASSDKLLTSLTNHRRQNKSINQFSNFLINEPRLCANKKTNENILLAFLIHSHRNNFMRRQAMRDTWLQRSQLDLFELFSTLSIEDIISEKDLRIILDLNKKKITLVHLFILGDHRAHVLNNKSSVYLQSMRKIQHESEQYRDILLIDVIENYHNLIHKHLTVLNWAVNYCPQATYVIKLDDDVFVNIKRLGRHLVTNLGLNYANSHMMHCGFIDRALPARSTKSKWYVDEFAYPYKYYPRYCEGYSYITNVPTLRLMHEQAKLIPQFWIDDVYVTGLLLHGMSSVKWIGFRDLVSVSVYDFWDIGSYFNRLYSLMLGLISFDVADFYKLDLFVILHTDRVNKAVYDYDRLDSDFNCSSSSSDLLTKLKCSNQSRVYNNVIDLKFYDFCAQLNLK